MELLTRSYDKNWNRIVHLYVNRDDDLKTTIDDPTTCKAVLIESGNLLLQCNEREITITAPALLFLNHEDRITVRRAHALDCDVIYFRPEVINDTLQYDALQGQPNQSASMTAVQDRYLLNAFYEFGKPINKVLPLLPGPLQIVRSLFRHIETELTEQKDGFWPCRSRSYFLELLFFIDRNNHTDEVQKTLSWEITSQKESLDAVQQVIAFMNEHIAEKVTLADLTRKFGLNRNRLNELFVKATKRTAIQYLQHMRLELSALLLQNTEIPVEEVAYRTGFQDPSYFAKSFKAAYHMTPLHYRKNAQ